MNGFFGDFSGKDKGDGEARSIAVRTFYFALTAGDASKLISAGVHFSSEKPKVFVVAVDCGLAHDFKFGDRISQIRIGSVICRSAKPMLTDTFCAAFFFNDGIFGFLALVSEGLIGAVVITTSHALLVY